MYLEYNMFSTIVDPKKTTQEYGDLIVYAYLTVTRNNDFESGFKILSHQPYASSLSPSCYYYAYFDLVPLPTAFPRLHSFFFPCGNQAHFIYYPIARQASAQ